MNIKVTTAKLADAWRRPEFTGVFVLTWVRIAPGVYSLIQMERAA